MKTNSRHRVFVVDDHPIFRLGISSVLSLEIDMEVCGQASNTRQALDGLRRIPADAAVLDVSLPGANGLELLKHLRAEHPDLRILMLSVHDEHTYALRCLRAGASGYLMKSDVDAKLIQALRKILAGGIYVSSVFGEQLIYKVSGDYAHTQGQSSPLDALSDRELEIFQLVGQAKSSRDIADDLHLSIKTVESHRLHIKEKLALGDSTKMVRYAMEWVATQTL